MSGKRIGLVAPPGRVVARRLLEGLGEWSGVAIRTVTHPVVASLDGLIVVAHEPAAVVSAFSNSPIPVLVVADSPTPAPTPSDRAVRFAESDRIDRGLRGVILPEPGGEYPPSFAGHIAGEVLASKGDRPAWIRWPVAGPGLDLVLCSPPAVPDGEYLHNYFSADRFLSLLPWLDFVRRVRGADGWQTEPLQACIVFDDPSLYRPRYGYLDFEALGRYATAHDYHVAIATVPLDLSGAAWETSSIFRRYSAALSLITHGNNHLSREMARPRSAAARLQLASQAIRRIRRFEATHHLRVGRVMEAPHAVYVPEAFPALLAVGFEAALVTPGLLEQGVERTHLPAAFGLAADGRLGGLPWVPRVRWRDGWRTEVLLASFLRQPIVVAGHHQDLAEGLEAVGEIADTINQQGDVQWSATDELVRRRARRRIEGETLVAKTHAYQATISVPNGVRYLVIERPGPGLITVSQEGRILASISSADRVVGPFALRGTSDVSVQQPVPFAVSPDEVPAPPTRLWPVVRKVIVEVRDRSEPALKLATRRPARPTTEVPVSPPARV